REGPQARRARRAGPRRGRGLLRGRAGREAVAVPPRRPPRGGRPPSRVERHGLGGEQVEGRQAVRELLAAGRRRAREVWLADDLDPAPVLDEIQQLAAKARVPVRRVPRARLVREARTEAPQGVLARAEPLADV